MNEEEARKNKYEIDRLLSLFWQDGWMNSETITKIKELFPPRLKEI